MLKFIYILFFSFSFFPCARAQGKKYVYYDSAVMTQQPAYDTAEVSRESIDVRSGDDHSTLTGNDTSGTIDTTLYLNQLKVPPDSVENWKKLKAFEYAKYLDSLLKANQEKELKVADSSPSGPSWLDTVFSSPVTKVFFWTLAGLFILFILYKLFLTEGLFKKKSTTTQSPGPEVNEEMITNESDFDHLISQALLNGNFRLAVRYQYLKTLHKLSDHHFIELTTDKTNYQYVREIGSHGGPAVNQQFQNDFASLTQSYEYVWYGEFAIAENIYYKIETGFTNFNQKF